MRRTILLGLCLILAACGAAPESRQPTGSPPPVAAPAPSAPAPSPPAPAAATSVPGVDPQPARPTPEAERPAGVPLAITAQARMRLARPLGLRPEELAVAGAEPRDWPDTSLGCPDPAALYAEQVTPGYLLRLSGPDGAAYAVHSDASGATMILCRDGRPVALDPIEMRREP